MRDEYRWLGVALQALFRSRPGDDTSLRNLAAVTERVDARTETVATAIERISKRLGA